MMAKVLLVVMFRVVMFKVVMFKEVMFRGEMFREVRYSNYYRSVGDSCLACCYTR